MEQSLHFFILKWKKPARKAQAILAYLVQWATKKLFLICFFFFVCSQDSRTDLFSCFSVEWVYDITVLSTWCLLWWHSNKVSIVAFNDFHIMNNKCVVNCERSNCFQLAVILSHQSDSDVCNVQVLHLPLF